MNEWYWQAEEVKEEDERLVSWLSNVLEEEEV
jgi:hypothetical protein